MKTLFFFLLLCAAFTSRSQSNWKAFARSVFTNKNGYKIKSSLAVTSSYKISTSSPDISVNATIIPTPNSFIRYTVVAEEGSKTYIKILPKCKYDQNSQTIVYADHNYTRSTGETNPMDYVYEVTTSSLNPNNHYLASSALIGKLVTIPVRFRKEKWDVDQNWSIEGSFNIGYAFGWKVKVCNNPYKRNYFNVVPYTIGISSQKYFTLTKSLVSGKDSVTAKTDQVALTYYSCGITYETDKLHIGIFGGVDKMFGKSKDWVYQNKWWWGIGLGYDIFK
ncbi:hypothetical protein [Ferruginibacter sp. HRS2-29]|uniref:hypothetical protein n=1 Tax=Ferruginibacter sp. HRS2-29 TaxID=2487334 RepID=UPI0020CC63CC|nr:hypothetical protein [Ferruginibacter sp. HRS2-29]MCP9750007.1 hypothetical protein [Ferruginibacter sp. HRS2-29]